jgi:hypothetical protein
MNAAFISDEFFLKVVLKYLHENEFANTTADASRAGCIARAVQFPIKPVCQQQRAFFILKFAF